ncbi:hypothetical protein PLESTB_000111700 [Pleodorina starrii]|uniref:Uncharacterized protein n=1 Tax=Pleodorina starrii TaxID=330485 RepID=A0A9W6BAE8_9CHLO|nr:hypothetical protein PLESTB_000111700 [Pleodorina starrii]GLC71884.1 hypothetical protein PLESTF_001177300 [Pleodorina starrii]
MGSGRTTTPRPFVLNVVLPPLRGSIEPPEPQLPHAPEPEQQQQSSEPTTQPADECTATGSQSCLFQPPPVRSPHLKDLYFLTSEWAMARELMPCAATAAATPQRPGDADLQNAGSMPSPATLQPGSAVAAAQHGALTAARTPMPPRNAGMSPLAAAALQQCSPWHAVTPMEGVPERFFWPGSARRAVAMPRPAGSPGSDTCSTSGTPIEGVPERLTKRRVSLGELQGHAKRRRCSMLPPTYWPLAAVENTPRAMNRPADSAAKSPGHDWKAGGPQHGDREPRGAGTPAVADEECERPDLTLSPSKAALAGAAAKVPAADSPAEDRSLAAAGSAEDPAGGEPRARNLEQEHMTAADIAAAASAAARAALARLQALVTPAPSHTSRSEAAAPSASRGSVSRGSVSRGSAFIGISDLSPCSNTPAVVKIQNLALTAADAVQRVEQLLRRAPSTSEAQSLCRSGLPPRPPSVAGLLAAKAAAAGTQAVSVARDVANSAQRRVSFGLDEQPGSASLIHRAAPDALVFPSRTPSPMFGFKWMPPPQLPPAELAAALGAAAVTPGVTLAPFGAAGATVSEAESPDAAAADRRGPAVATRNGGSRSPVGSSSGRVPGAQAAVAPAAETSGASFGRDGVSVGSVAAGLSDALASMRRHDQERHLMQDEELAQAEVMALPDESDAAEQFSQDAMRGGRRDGAGMSSQLLVEPQRGALAAAAAAAAAAVAATAAVTAAAAPGRQGPHRAPAGHACGQLHEASMKQSLTVEAAQPLAASAFNNQSVLGGGVLRAAQDPAHFSNRAPSNLPFGAPSLLGGLRWLQPPQVPEPQGLAVGAGMASTRFGPTLAPFAGAYAPAPAAAAATTAAPVAAATRRDSAGATRSNKAGPERSAGGQASGSGAGSARELTANPPAGSFPGTGGVDDNGDDYQDDGPGADQGGYDVAERRDSAGAAHSSGGSLERSAGGQPSGARFASGPMADAPGRSFRGAAGGDNDDGNDYDDQDNAPAAGARGYAAALKHSASTGAAGSAGGGPQRSAGNRSLGVRSASGLTADAPSGSLRGTGGGDDGAEDQVDRAGKGPGGYDTSARRDSVGAARSRGGDLGGGQPSGRGAQSLGARAASRSRADAPAGSFRPTADGDDDGGGEDDQDDGPDGYAAAERRDSAGAARSGGGASLARSAGGRGAGAGTAGAPAGSVRSSGAAGRDGDGGDGNGCERNDAPAAAGPGGPGGPTPSRLLASVLRHDLEQRDSDDEELAMKEVAALPGEPDEDHEIAVRAGAPPNNKGINGAGPSNQPAPAAQQQQRAAAAAAAGPQRVARASTIHAHEERLLGRRKSLAAAGHGLTIDEELGTRRSTRTRVRPLEYWRGETKSYGRNHKTMPTVNAITMRTPEPQWPLPTGKEEKAKRRARTKAKEEAAAAAAT